MHVIHIYSHRCIHIHVNKWHAQSGMGLPLQAIWSTPWNRHLLLLARGQSNIGSTWKVHVCLCVTCWATLENEPDRPWKPTVQWTEQSTGPHYIIWWMFAAWPHHRVSVLHIRNGFLASSSFPPWFHYDKAPWKTAKEWFNETISISSHSPRSQRHQATKFLISHHFSFITFFLAPVFLYPFSISCQLQNNL